MSYTQQNRAIVGALVGTAALILTGRWATGGELGVFPVPGFPDLNAPDAPDLPNLGDDSQGTFGPPTTSWNGCVVVRDPAGRIVKYLGPRGQALYRSQYIKLCGEP